CIMKRTWAQWTNLDRNLLLKDVVGPWEFGEYRYLAQSRDQSDFEGGAGKSNLVQKLFHSEIYNKKKKQCSGSNCSESDFCEMIWDLEYGKCEYTTKEFKKIVQELNKDKPGEVIIKNNQVYWRRFFSEFKKHYLRDYLHCKELFDYKQQICASDSDLLQLKDQHFEIDNNIKKELSKPDFDDSEYTSQQKKR
ncbi:5956_t:CDS:2, partial [Dentiscutata heterogama]